MSKMSKTARRLMLLCAVYTAVLMAAGAAVILTALNRDMAYAGRYMLGVLLGGAVSAVKVPLMEANINKTLDMPPGQARAVAPVQFFARNFLVLAALVISAVLPRYFNLFGAVLGVLVLSFAAYSLRLFENVSNRQGANPKSGS